MYLYGKTETLQDGTKITVNDEYIVESLQTPGKKVVQGYAPSMPAYKLSGQELQTLLEFLRLLKNPNSN